MKQIFEGIFSSKGKILTKNFTPGKKVYGEKLVKTGSVEYREWNPYRSKLCAAIKKGLKKLEIKKGLNVLYLGVAEGTTASHLSDVIEEKGLIFGVDLSQRTMKKFIELCEDRENLVPVLENAEKPEKYEKYLKNSEISLLYQDLSQRKQAQIFNKNAKKFLKKGKLGIIAIKAKSISSTENIEKIFEKQKEELKKEFDIIECIPLQPYEKSHLLCVMKKK